MSSKEELKQLVAALDHDKSIEENEKTLQSISALVEKHGRQNTNLKVATKQSKLLTVLTKVLEKQISEYEKQFPKWIIILLTEMKHYSGDTELFKLEEFGGLLDVLRCYMEKECWDVLECFRLLAPFDVVKPLMIQDAILDKLKPRVDDKYTLGILRNLAYNFEEGQLKLLEDKQFVLKLVELVQKDSKIWFLFTYLSQHPDAKVLLPPEVLATAMKEKHMQCIDVSLLLCSDDDLKNIDLTAEWITKTVDLLNDLLSKGRATYGTTNHSLLELVLPIANLSVVESLKHRIGSQVLTLLLKLVTDTKNMPDTWYVRRNLKRGRQEASRALWNFAYLASNREILEGNNGVEKLKKALADTSDPILKKNIEGILYMFTSSASAPIEIQVKTDGSKGHIMISYNWGNQPTVKLLAKSLKERGFQVWLDIEQMEGSTLEAMAAAVEQADMVLMCMSQKYKDSPNCRLEGEYCMNRRVPFVPLMMQQGYKPDGWLGISLGAKLWFDFSNQDNWSSKIDGLIKVIGSRGKGKLDTSSSSILPTASPPSSANSEQPERKPIEEWNMDDVHEWMKAEHIEHHYELFREHRISGRALQELKRLHSLQQSSFISHFHQHMGIVQFGEMLLLSAAINKL